MTMRLSAEERTQLDPAETHAFASPIPCQVISNGEFLPAPQGPLQQRFEVRLKRRADLLAKQHGLSRRAFLCTASGMASAFLAMNEVYGAVFQVSEAEAADTELGDEHARELSDQFVLDVHTHFLRDDTRLKNFVALRTDTGRRGYNPALAQRAQTIEDLKFPTYVKEVFLDSDTKIAVHSRRLRPGESIRRLRAHAGALHLRTRATRMARGHRPRHRAAQARRLEGLYHRR
jgi:hypothetical protein